MYVHLKQIQGPISHSCLWTVVLGHNNLLTLTLSKRMTSQFKSTMNGQINFVHKVLGANIIYQLCHSNKNGVLTNTNALLAFTLFILKISFVWAITTLTFDLHVGGQKPMLLGDPKTNLHINFRAGPSFV